LQTVMGNNKNDTTMTRLFIMTALFLQVTCGFGQTDTTKRISNKWTIGTILMSEQNPYFERTFTPNFFNGIVFKRHFDYFTTRIGIEYVKLIDKKDEPECCDQLYSEGYTNEGMIRLGIEKGFTIKKHYRPYLALDFTGIKSYSNKTVSGGFSGIYQRVITNATGFGATPTIGFEYKMTKNLSVAFETRLRLIYTKTTNDIDNLYDNLGSYRRQDEQFQKNFNRIGALTLNFNF